MLKLTIYIEASEEPQFIQNFIIRWISLFWRVKSEIKEMNKEETEFIRGEKGWGER